MDWRDVARERGVPVWEGCIALDDENDWWRILEVSRSGGVIRVRTPYRGRVAEDRPAGLIPLLTDPDTQPAYLRRLAVRLGCSEEVAALGVCFGEYHDDRDYVESTGEERARRVRSALLTRDYRPSPTEQTWVLIAGADRSAHASVIEAGWESEPMRLPRNRLLALALAWPKEGA